MSNGRCGLARSDEVGGWIDGSNCGELARRKGEMQEHEEGWRHGGWRIEEGNFRAKDRFRRQRNKSK